tara:strand:- start:633 stop:986 length:354 start_codon:yes stop_codon:yes gene_type:complete
MKNAMMVATLCTMISLSSFGQCASTFIVQPVNMWEDVFTYEVDQIFNDICYQAVQPVTVDRFSMMDITAQSSTFIITVTNNSEIIDSFVINPGPKVDGCTSWVTSSLNGSLTNLSIQ